MQCHALKSAAAPLHCSCNVCYEDGPFQKGSPPARQRRHSGMLSSKSAASAGRLHLVAEEPHRRMELRGVPRGRLAAAAIGPAPAGSNARPAVGGATGPCAQPFSGGATAHSAADGSAGGRHSVRRPDQRRCLRSAADRRAARRRPADRDADDRQRSAGAHGGPGETAGEAQSQASESADQAANHSAAQQRRQRCSKATQEAADGPRPSQGTSQGADPAEADRQEASCSSPSQSPDTAKANGGKGFSAGNP